MASFKNLKIENFRGIDSIELKGITKIQDNETSTSVSLTIEGGNETPIFSAVSPDVLNGTFISSHMSERHSLTMISDLVKKKKDYIVLEAIKKFDPYSDIYNTCTLYVPQEAYSDYWIAPYWAKYNNIIGQFSKSISDIEASILNVYSENGSIIVQCGKLGDTVDIYNVSGVLLHKIKITEYLVRITVAPQKIYIVNTGDKSFRIAMQ